MMKPKNIIFDVHGVLFEYNPKRAEDGQKLFVPHIQGIALLNECVQKKDEKGHAFFICTNLVDTNLEILKQEYPGIVSQFAGIVHPGRANAKKPDPGIFQYLLDQYQLNPEESLFIDDQQINVIGAQEAGILGIHAADFVQVRRELELLGVL